MLWKTHVMGDAVVQTRLKAGKVLLVREQQEELDELSSRSGDQGARRNNAPHAGLLCRIKVSTEHTDAAALGIRK